MIFSFLQPGSNHLRQIIINEVQRRSVICPKSLSNNGWSFDPNLNGLDCQAHFHWAFTDVSSRCFSTFEAQHIFLIIYIFYNKLKLSDYKQLLSIYLACSFNKCLLHRIMDRTLEQCKQEQPASQREDGARKA